MAISGSLTNFTAGELSELLDGRIDHAKYFNGCKRMLNMIPRPFGPATRRGGTHYVCEAGVESSKVRLRRFQFSTEQAYIIEIGHYYMRFFKDHGVIVSGSPAVPYTIATPYPASDIFELKFSQSADVLYITHNDYRPRTLTRTGHASWTLALYSLQDGPFLPVNDDTTWTMTPSGTTGTITLTSSKDLFESGHVGAVFRLRHNGKSVKAGIYGGYTSGSLRLKGDFYCSLQASPTNGFNGKVTIQKSFDNTTWYDVASMTTTRVQDFWEDKDGVYYRFTVKEGDFVEGNAEVDLYQHEHWGLVQITSVVSALVANATVLIPIGDPLVETPTTYRSNGSIFTADCSSLTGWTDGDTGTGASTQVTFDSKSCFKFDSGTAGDIASRSRDCSVSLLPNRTILTLNTYVSASTGYAAGDYFEAVLEFPAFKLGVALAADGLFIRGGASWQLVSSLSLSAWNELTFAVDKTAKTVDVYMAGALVAPDIDCNWAGTFTDGLLTLTQYGGTTANQISYVDSISIGADFLNTGSYVTTEWMEGAWSEKRGWPVSCVFFEDRLWFAGTKQQPQTIWGSKTGDYANHVPGTKDDSAIVVTLNSNEVNPIRWLATRDRILAGTSTGEWGFGATNPSDAIRPMDFKASQLTRYGASDVVPIEAGNAVLFVQRAGKKMRELTYLLQADGYVAQDLTILSEHVLKSGVVGTEYQQEPDGLVWTHLGDGTLAAMTYLRDENVIGWGPHSTQNGEIESIASMPVTDRDEVWMVVKRTINGRVRRYIEYMDHYDFGDDVADAFFVDCGSTYSGTPASTISGLDYLEGQTVQILADGSVCDDQVVDDGQITLAKAASKVHVGLKMTSILGTMRLEVPGGGGGVGKIKRANFVRVLFNKTLGAQYGPSETDLHTIAFRGRDPMDAPPPLFTGPRTIEFDGDYTEDPRVYIVQEQPLPMTVVAIFPEYETLQR